MPLSQNGPDGRVGAAGTGAAPADGAADRTQRQERDTRPSFAAELARLKKRRSDILMGFDNLRERKARGVDTTRDLKRQAIKLQIVDGKLFALRQLDLLTVARNRRPPLEMPAELKPR